MRRTMGRANIILSQEITRPEEQQHQQPPQWQWQPLRSTTDCGVVESHSLGRFFFSSVLDQGMEII